MLPILMGREETKELSALGQLRKQRPRGARQPPREGPAADACERMQPSQGDHLTGPEAGLGSFEEACQMVSNLTAEGRDTRDGRGHRRLRSWQGCTLSTSVEEVHDYYNKAGKDYWICWFVSDAYHWLPMGWRAMPVA